MNFIKEKLKKILLAYLIFLLPIWIFYFLKIYFFKNNIYILGIQPYHLSIFTPIQLISSWLIYKDINHIVSTTIVLIPLLFIFSLKEYKNITLLFMLILISGILTWFLGDIHEIVIGGAGFIFLIFTYMFMQLLFTKNVLYLLTTLFFGFPYISSFFNHFFLDLYQQNSFISKIIVLFSDLIKNLF